MNKISHSAWSKYLNCGKMYDLHYNKRLRPTTMSSALFFGVAIDEGLNELLITNNIEKAVDKFRSKFEFKDLKDTMWDQRDLQDFLISGHEIKDYNERIWSSMRVKGRMLLEQYNIQIMPLIDEVVSVQKELDNGPGVLDAILNLRGHGRVLVDHKTSARPYKPDSVASDTQLALYAADQGCVKAGFIVLVKEIKPNLQKTCVLCGFNGSYTRHKTCPQIISGNRCHGTWKETIDPEAQIQLIIDNVPQANKDLVKNSFHQVEKAIDAGIYPENLKSCGKLYGKPCQYIDFCWKNDLNGLQYKKEEK